MPGHLGGATAEMVAFSLVAAQCDGGVKGGDSLSRPPGAHQEFSPHRRKPVMMGEPLIEPVEQQQPGVRPVGFHHRDGASQADHR